MSAQHTADAGQPESPERGGLSGLPTTVVSLRIIEALGQAGAECGVTELAQALDMPKARVHRHLVNLRDSGYVAQNPRNSRYSIGWRLYLLGQQLVNRYDVVSLAKPVMEALRDQLGQTVVISTYTDQGMVVLDFLSGRRAVEIVMRAGTRFNFNAVAQGKIALAYGPPELLEKTLAGPLEASTRHTITDPERLRSEVELARRRGWADAPEEIFTGVNALAAPIFRGDGSLYGTLALTGSIHYLPSKPLEPTVVALLTAAREISTLLGYRLPR
ncbi:IclR family transcriptional regulator [Alkalilimnicola sp. S0819]|uniref:IclR family transcriptional regulator n=1 Tax=Alkalilimnicola sp. S0819 TaxID=2613922 RepID=UPI001869A818|nr:IclR family transcriptional regulator [Alkalilimnicola sp. S0819]